MRAVVRDVLRSRFLLTYQHLQWFFGVLFPGSFYVSTLCYIPPGTQSWELSISWVSASSYLGPTSPVWLCHSSSLHLMQPGMQHTLLLTFSTSAQTTSRCARDSIISVGTWIIHCICIFKGICMSRSVLSFVGWRSLSSAVCLSSLENHGQPAAFSSPGFRVSWINDPSGTWNLGPCKGRWQMELLAADPRACVPQLQMAQLWTTILCAMF